MLSIETGILWLGRREASGFRRRHSHMLVQPHSLAWLRLEFACAGEGTVRSGVRSDLIRSSLEMTRWAVDTNAKKSMCSRSLDLFMTVNVRILEGATCDRPGHRYT